MVENGRPETLAYVCLITGARADSLFYSGGPRDTRASVGLAIPWDRREDRRVWAGIFVNRCAALEPPEAVAKVTAVAVVADERKGSLPPRSSSPASTHGDVVFSLAAQEYGSESLHHG